MSEELTALQSKVDSLESKLADKEKELDGLQSLKGKWSNEVGDVRKKTEDLTSTIAELKTALDEVKGDRDSLKSELDALKTRKASEDNQPPEPKLSAKEEADSLESSLTDEQKKMVEEVLKDEGGDAIEKFSSDDKFRVAVLKQATAGSGDGGPSSLWRVKPKPSSDDLVKKVEQMFNKHKGKDTAQPTDRGYGKPRVIKAEEPGAANKWV